MPNGMKERNHFPGSCSVCFYCSYVGLAPTGDFMQIDSVQYVNYSVYQGMLCCGINEVLQFKTCLPIHYADLLVCIRLSSRGEE